MDKSFYCKYLAGKSGLPADKIKIENFTKNFDAYTWHAIYFDLQIFSLSTVEEQM